MKTNPFLLLILLAAFFCSCANTRNLPKVNDLGTAVHGSYIRVNQWGGPNIRGELISAHDSGIVVLSYNNEVCEFIPFKSINRFRLIYAQPMNLGWTIPLMTASTASHGWFLVFSAPINFFLTTFVSTEPYSHTQETIAINELNAYARFPQGIPKNLSLDSIK